MTTTPEPMAGPGQRVAPDGTVTPWPPAPSRCPFCGYNHGPGRCMNPRRTFLGRRVVEEADRRHDHRGEGAVVAFVLAAVLGILLAGVLAALAVAAFATPATKRPAAGALSVTVTERPALDSGSLTPAAVETTVPPAPAISQLHHSASANSTNTTTAPAAGDTPPAAPAPLYTPGAMLHCDNLADGTDAHIVDGVGWYPVDVPADAVNADPGHFRACAYIVNPGPNDGGQQ